MTDDEITPLGAELIAGLNELVDVLESGEPLEDHFVVWTLRRDGADRRRAMIGVGDRNRKIEQLQTENAALRAEIERLKRTHDDGPFEAMATRLDVEAYETLTELGVDPGFGNCFGEGPSIVNAEAKRLKAEVERLTSPHVREIDMGVNEQLIDERDKARADLAEAVGLMHLILIRGNLCSPDVCDACEEFREFLAKHWSHP